MREKQKFILQNLYNMFVSGFNSPIAHIPLYESLLNKPQKRIVQLHPDNSWAVFCISSQYTFNVFKLFLKHSNVCNSYVGSVSSCKLLKKLSQNRVLKTIDLSKCLRSIFETTRNHPLKSKKCLFKIFWARSKSVALRNLSPFITKDKFQNFAFAEQSFASVILHITEARKGKLKGKPCKDILIQIL